LIVTVPSATRIADPGRHILIERREERGERREERGERREERGERREEMDR